jgi:hypothetical protein
MCVLAGVSFRVRRSPAGVGLSFHCHMTILTDSLVRSSIRRQSSTRVPNPPTNCLDLSVVNSRHRAKVELGPSERVRQAFPRHGRGNHCCACPERLGHEIRSHVSRPWFPEVSNAPAQRRANGLELLDAFVHGLSTLLPLDGRGVPVQGKTFNKWHSCPYRILSMGCLRKRACV